MSAAITDEARVRIALHVQLLGPLQRMDRSEPPKPFFDLDLVAMVASRWLYERRGVS